MIKKIILSLFFLLISSCYLLVSAHADEIEDLQRQINELSQARTASEQATKPLEGQLDSLKRQLAQIQAKLDNLTANIRQKERDLKLREDKLVTQQALLNSRVRSYYIRSFFTSPLMVILSTNSSGDLFRELSYRQAATKEDQRVIGTVTSEMLDLLTQKEKLEVNKAKLASVQVEVDKNADYLAGEIGKAKAFQADLSNKIASLTARQQEILSAKSGTFTTSVGDVPLADDPKSQPTYNPGFSPAFAMFSFGAYTHRNGLSQYGAKGRAESGQNAEAILSHYYPGASLNKSYSMPATISVDGYGSMAFEDSYMKRIYEMPNSFPKEALKAQAVAARTYAVRRGGSICPTESCQVYKNENKGGAWEEAVNETRGWVLEGGPSAQYSSTTGGYLNNSGWDTKCGNQGCWTPEAYEKIAGSPWFYKGWYTQGYAIGSNSCGRGHPWLSLEEMADILNAYLVQGKGEVDGGRITPATTSCWSGNPYSLSELRDLANSVGGGAVTSINSVSVSYSTGGSTSSVNFSTNRGSISIGGGDFKTIYNLRAPGYISIRSPLYNVERK